ncbi:GNAT family N-acetyltransferase [Leifsonia sp. NPDC058292]|uniref:GNAT family N-acetyltransferase n=1 Tax=Leifsonia sp. NPDC058292 TaxID=3346428 RepID=UPI0036DBFB7C
MENGEIVGALGYTVDGGVADIDRLVVDPAYHRRGIGARLVRSALTVAPRLSCPRAGTTLPRGGCTKAPASRTGKTATCSPASRSATTPSRRLRSSILKRTPFRSASGSPPAPGVCLYSGGLYSGGRFPPAHPPAA